jgi:hypothetical protein
MALFSLTDIQFNVPGVRRGISQLTEQSKYNLNTFRYPIDLGSVDKGHYMVININEQISTSFPGQQAAGILPTIKANQQTISSSFGSYTVPQNASDVIDLATDLIKLGISQTGFGSQVNKFKEQISSIPGVGLTKKGLGSFKQKLDTIGVRSVRRITDTIALYMPDTLNFDYNQSYSELRPGEQFEGKLLSAGSGIVETLKAGGSVETVKANLAKTLSPFAFKALSSSFGDVGKILFTAGTGGAVSNPMLELIYASPSFREFRFDFLLYPRSQREALEVNQILNRLRFHQAPELVKNTGGAFLYPPSEFDISFYYNGKINPNIPRISTCVLTGIQTDYAPNGFAAYEVPGGESEFGGTGMPVAIRLSLSFKETEYLVKGSPVLSNVDKPQYTNQQLNEFRRASQAGELGTS